MQQKIKEGLVQRGLIVKTMNVLEVIKDRLVQRSFVLALMEVHEITKKS